jgi:6-phosphogluconate dehydrogenase
MPAKRADQALADFGVLGLGVMGQNLALNIERHGWRVALWNREQDWTDRFLTGAGAGKNLAGTDSIQSFVAALAKPRRILIMIKAGDPVDWTIAQLRPLLEQGDILIDGGNSHFADTRRREKDLSSASLNFIGSGVSGGETGALWGPSLMPGGRREAYEFIKPIWEAIAAKVDDGPCVTYVGPDGAGHFVKMVHNGIEYGDMQLIAEAYDILRRVGGLGIEELADTFAKWNEGPLQSYLIEITAQILTVRDPETHKPLVDLIVDAAGQKGTGRWASTLALELAVAIPTIHAAIEARVLSGLRDERKQAQGKLTGPQPTATDRADLVQAVHDALYASKICSYAQGMALIRAGSKEYSWNIDLAEMARIWKGGCIIRARFLDDIKQAFRRTPDLPNLLLDKEFGDWLNAAQARWRKAVSTAQAAGVPVLAMASSLAYFDTYRTEHLPQNLTQAQRDFFGAHTYERVDKPKQGPIHTDWVSLVAGPSGQTGQGARSKE